MQMCYIECKVRYTLYLDCEVWQVLRVQCCATVSVSSASYFLATVTILPSHCLLSATSRNPAATCSHVVDNIVPVDNGSVVTCCLSMNTEAMFSQSLGGMMW